MFDFTTPICHCSYHMLGMIQMKMNSDLDTLNNYKFTVIWWSRGEGMRCIWLCVVSIGKCTWQRHGNETWFVNPQQEQARKCRDHPWLTSGWPGRRNGALPLRARPQETAAPGGSHSPALSFGAAARRRPCTGGFFFHVIGGQVEQWKEVWATADPFISVVQKKNPGWTLRSLLRVTRHHWDAQLRFLSDIRRVFFHSRSIEIHVCVYLYGRVTQDITSHASDRLDIRKHFVLFCTSCLLLQTFDFVCRHITRSG